MRRSASPPATRVTWLAAALALAGCPSPAPEPPGPEERYELRTLRRTVVNHGGGNSTEAVFEYDEDAHIHWHSSTTYDEAGAIVKSATATLDTLGFWDSVTDYDASGASTLVVEWDWDPATYLSIGVRRWSTPDHLGGDTLLQDFRTERDEEGRRLRDGGQAWGFGDAGKYLLYDGGCRYTLAAKAPPGTILNRFMVCDFVDYDPNGAVTREERSEVDEHGWPAWHWFDFDGDGEPEYEFWYVAEADDAGRLVRHTGFATPARTQPPIRRQSVHYEDDVVSRIVTEGPAPRGRLTPLGQVEFRWLPHPTAGPTGWRSETMSTTPDGEVWGEIYTTVEWTETEYVRRQYSSTGALLRTSTSELERVLLPPPPE